MKVDVIQTTTIHFIVPIISLNNSKKYKEPVKKIKIASFLAQNLKMFIFQS